MENTEELGQILKETQKAIELSQDGNWIPLGIVAAVFSIIILLLLYIWNQMIKNNNARHEQNELLLKEISETLSALKDTSIEHKTKIDYLEKNI